MSLTLAEANESSYEIVLPFKASVLERYAAHELRRYIRQISGVVLPLRPDTDPMGKCELMIGFSAHTAQLSCPATPGSLGRDGVCLYTEGAHIALLGSSENGALHAVYAFLDKVCGCRWFTPELSRIPHRAVLTVPELNETHLPALEYRDPYFAGAFNGDWCARNHVNGFHADMKPKHGGHITYAGFVHTFDTLIPADMYFDEHPDYYALIDGKRVRELTQPCLTNPAVFDTVLKAVRRQLHENPGAMIISVSQNDNYNYCRCPHCAAVDAEEGSHAGTILRFVNRIAEALAGDYPNLIVDTLAYQYTRKPPRLTRPLPNVAVRLCSIECCFSHPMEDCRHSASFQDKGGDTTFQDDLEGWGAICNRVYIWDYVTNFANYLLPFPNFGVLQKNIQYFVRHHVRGVFEEGNYSAGGGEFSELRQYLLARLLWNPDTDLSLDAMEFLVAYYGDAAPLVGRYLKRLQELVTPEVHIGFHDTGVPEYLGEGFVAEGMELLERAMCAAEDDRIRRRVGVIYAGLLQIQLLRTPFGSAQYVQRLEQFDMFTKWCGITELREVKPLEYSLKELRVQGNI